MSTIGTKIVLEGEKEYRSAIYNVNKSIGTLKSELRAVSAEFEGNANSIEALRKKNEVLNKQQAEQEKLVKLLRGALEDAAKQYGENSNKVLDWQRKLNNASAYLIKLNREIEDNEKYLKEAEQSTDKTAKSIDEFGKSIEGVSQKTSIFGDVLKANLLSSAIRDGVRKLASELGEAIEQSIDLASDLEEVQNVVDVTFGESASSIDSWAESMGEAHGVSVLFSKQFAGTMGAMLKSMQVTDEQVVEMSKNLVQLAGDMASFYNIDVEEAFTKIRSGISGETEPLKQLGINLNVANLEAYALAQGINKAYSEMTQAEQVTLRYNYLLQATADAQGDFARNIDSLANQQRITELQREEILMKLGDAVIPAVTRATTKLNEAMDGMGDELAEVAEILAEGVVNAFIWMVDNSDKVIAGLKGIGAAIVTKKTADGVMYLVNAYKTLTTATEAATAAQLAYNTATKTNIYIALASAIIGISTALVSYAKNARDSAEETERLNSETYKLIDSSKKLNEEIESSRQKRLEDREAIVAQSEGAKQLADTLYELANKEKKTSEEKEQMIVLTKKLNELIPDLNLKINEQTWALNLNEEATSRLIDKQLEYQMVLAAQDDIGRIATDRYNAEKKLTELLEDQEKLEQERAEAQEKYLTAARQAAGTEWGLSGALIKADQLYTKAKEAYDKNEKAIESTRELIKGLDQDYQYALKFVGQHSNNFRMVEEALDAFGEKYKKYLDEQAQAEIGTLEDKQKQINRIYSETSKELEKRLRAEERAFAKSQEKRVEEVQKAQQKELKEVEKSHKRKLELLNDEYLQKIKAVDEDRYKELKKVQDQIDAIDAQQEAEERALKAREEAEEKAELKARIENAKTVEERLEAQKELRRYEERLARERLKEERSLQKDILKEQIDTINKSYDEKIKAIEAEQKAEQEKLAEQLKNEKEAINERYKLKLEALREEQELERDALRERQAEYREYLREQKELAIANAKETYEAELAEFKMLQALKYEEAVSSEAQMRKVIQEYAYKSMQPGKARDTILRSNDLNEMLAYYNPTAAIKSSVPQQVSIDYSLIENAMASALRKLNLSVKLDKKVIGQVVDERIRYNLR